MKKYIRQRIYRLQPDPSGLTAEQETLKAEMHINGIRALKNKRVFYDDSIKTQRKKNKRRKQHRERLLKTVDHLAQNMPKSEVWFHSLYSKEDITREFKERRFVDNFNQQAGHYIPDVHNFGYRYIIEIDGSFHDKPEQKERDIKKDYYFRKRGYLVIRIKAYDIDSYNLGMYQLRAQIAVMTEKEKIRRGK